MNAQQTDNMEKVYQERLTRYMTAMRNEKPDMIPIRPFVAEFTAKYAGYTCQQVCHDYNNAFAAAKKCAADFDWDAVVSNMVYVWTGMTHAMGLNYVGVPGIDTSANVGFQYREPGDDKAFMKSDEYDELIDDPTGFLYNVWLPRVSDRLSPIGDPVSYGHNLALVKGAMSMMQYFGGFDAQDQQLRSESGTVSAIAGILKAPFDIIGDKLRGYLGLTMDMEEQPEKVLKACEALAPHLLNVALGTTDPNKQVPVGYWMHRGCVPFVTPDQFNSHYWPTLKPIIEELWMNGHQTLFYAEGDWGYHLASFAELPDRSIVYHVDQGDIIETHQRLGQKFCLSGGIPNHILGFNGPQEVRDYCRKVIDGVAQDGGYIMDASAIMQNDTQVENMQALTDFTRDYGTYSVSPYKEPLKPCANADTSGCQGKASLPKGKTTPGTCVSWQEEVKNIPHASGDVKMLENVWNQIDGLGNVFIWQWLLSF